MIEEARTNPGAEAMFKLAVENGARDAGTVDGLVLANERLRAALDTAARRFELLALGHPGASAAVGAKEAREALAHVG